MGTAPYEARVFSWNAVGARVPGTGLDLQVNGEPISLQFDAWGLGTALLAEPGVYTLTSDVAGPARVAVVERLFDGLSLASVAPSSIPVDGAWSGQDGAVFLRDGAMWWWTQQRGAEPVLTVGSEAVRGVRLARLDEDDQEDLLVWTASRLYVLRAVPDGGLAWSMGLQVEAPERIGGVALGDGDGDGNTDLFVGVEGGEAPVVEEHAGNAVMRFALVERHEVEIGASSVGFGVERETRRQFLEVVSPDGGYHRYERAPGESFELVEEQAPVELSAGTEILGGGDFTGDGLEDSFLVAPRVPGAPRQIVQVDYGASPLRFVERAPVGAQVSIADGDGDGLIDLWTLDEGGSLKMLTAGGGTQVEWSLGELPTAGPFAVSEIDGREMVDVVSAGPDRFLVWPGQRGAEAPWRVRPDGLDNLLQDVRRMGTWSVLEDPPGTVRWGGVQEREGEVWLKVWRREAGADTVTELSRERLTDDSADWVDTAFCGSTAWALVGDRLWRYELATGIELALERDDVAGTAVACREDGWGAVLGDDEVLLVHEGTGDLRVPAVGVAGFVLGVGDPPEILGCATAGCSVIRWEVGGQALQVVGGRDTAEILTDTGPLLPFSGVPSIGDADGDGQTDLLLAGLDGTITLVRGTPGGPGHPEAWWLGRPLAGPAFLADANGDGVVELFAVGADGMLFVTSPSP